MNNDLLSLVKELNVLSAEDRIRVLGRQYGHEISLASSLGAEDQVLTFLLRKVSPESSVFVLDTGRLNQETYDVMQETQVKYQFQYQVFFPNFDAVEKMVSENGPNLFYYSVENRKACCYVRKVEPLRRALTDKKGWITGLRRAQSVTRQDLQVAEWDETHSMLKFNPLFDWSTEQLLDFIKKNDIPYNRLHDQGYPSIGCAPCTRTVEPGEDIRAGRWWWENPETKECGLHLKKT